LIGAASAETRTNWSGPHRGDESQKKFVKYSSTPIDRALRRRAFFRLRPAILQVDPRH